MICTGFIRTLFIRTLRAETVKALTLRGIQAALAASIVAPFGLALASGFFSDLARQAQVPMESQGFEVAGFGQPLIILLAALITGTEYLDGQIRTTLLATPRRGRVIAAKLVLVAGLSAVIGVIAIGLSVLGKRAALSHRGLAVGGFTSHMALNLTTVALNYALLGLIAAAVTIIARTFIVTLVVLVPLVLGVTISLIGVVPAVKYLPDLAGIQLLMRYPPMGLLDPLPGGIVMAAWTLVLVGLAWWLARVRDAPAG
ncbi:MAG: ABC transporter permease [Acidipropionibacterium sp.]|jgi:ABC-2 type transport system permease protein|nr:ABC transporter permease [Acidipropionibacterium sp.]